MPAEIKNLKKVAQRILKAIKNKEKIILYGDADLDGVSSVIILKETIKNLNGEIVAIYFPDREKEGYGISEVGLNHLKEFAPALLIALDCGIGNFKETNLAKKLGFEVIIIDHHQILDRLPQAAIIVDPKQRGDKYPFKGLATTGIIYKLSEILLKKTTPLPPPSRRRRAPSMTEALKKSLLELVALATIADMMPQENENKNFIEEGLSSLENSWSPGIQVFFQTEPFKNYGDLRQKVSKIISILNVRDLENQLPASYRLLTTSSKVEAKKLIEKLLEKNLRRRQRIDEMVEKVEEKILKIIDNPVLFEGDPSWELTLLSPVASIICHKYKKPTFLFKIEKIQSQGAVRVPQGRDGVKAMMSCRQLLETYGGHPLAAGFRIKNENLEKFKDCLIKYFQNL